MKWNLILLVLICTTFSAKGQVKKTKREQFPSFFGLIGAPVIPNNFIGEKESIFQDSLQRMTTNFENKWGYTFGASARFGLTKNISIETGITQIRRNYLVQVAIPDSGINRSQKLAFVNYDIPINALFYVKLSENIFASAALGISVSHYPTDVRDSIQAENNQTVLIEGRRIHRTYFATNAGFGFEYRTKKAGTFYIGTSAKVPFQPIFFGVSIYRKSGNGNQIVAFKPITAGYFTVDFRYYIPTPNKRNPISNKDIIE